MGFASFDALIAAVTVDEQVDQATYYKVSSQAAEAAGVWQTLWRDGVLPSAGGDGAAGSGTPGAGGTALSNADGGLSKGWANVEGSAHTRHLVAWDARSTTPCTLVLLDRLVSVSGVSLVGTGSKNVNSVALPSRATGGVGVQVFLEVTTITGGSAPVGTISYTDQSGNNGATSPTFTFPATATNVNTMIPIGYASGDYGVQSVETLTLATASTGSAACNVVLAKELARIPLESNLGNTRDFVSQVKVLPRIHDDATLMLAVVHSTSATATIGGTLYAAYD